MSQPNSYSEFIPLKHSSSLANDTSPINGSNIHVQRDSYSDFQPLRHSSSLANNTSPINGTNMYAQRDSYSQFHPLRQSSLLSDNTLPINGTNLYANISLVWPAGYQPKEKEVQKSTNELPSLNDETAYQTASCNNLASTLLNTLASTLPNSNTSLITNDITNDDQTLWTTALNVSSRQDEMHQKTFGEISEGGTFHTALDEIPLDDTLPMENDTSFNGTFVINWNCS